MTGVAPGDSSCRSPLPAVASVQAVRNRGRHGDRADGRGGQAAVAERLGSDASFDDSDGEWPALVKAWLGGRRVSVGLDGVGGAIGRGVFDQVAPGGRLVMSGSASGEDPALSAGDLYRTGVTVSAAVGAA